MESLYDGYSRALLRAGLAAVAAVALFTAAREVYGLHPSALSHPDAPRLLCALAGSALGVGVLVLVGVGALARFVRRPAALAAGVVALIVIGVLVETISAVSRGPKREFFSLGAALFGWLGGLVYARALWPGATRQERDEALAEAGAVAAFAATYVNAGVSKLLASGLGWSDSRTLRGIILTHHRIDDASLSGAYAQLIALHPGLAQALSLATLAIEVGAFIYLIGPRARLVWGALLLGFHVNVGLLANIGYLEARLLIVFFSLPWPRLLRRPRMPAAAAASPVDPLRHAEVALWSATALLLVAALAWVSPIRGYTSQHHHHDAGHSTPAESAKSEI